MKQVQKKTINSIALSLVFSLSVVSAFAQDAPSGKYEGTAKVAGSPDAQITLELKSESGKISGHLMNGETKIEVSEASFAEGKLSLKLGPAAKEGVLTATVTAEKISGDWVAGTQKKTVELKKAAAAAAVAPAAFNLTGEWDAVADASGQPFPFLLVLNIDGEKVTGSSSSQLGESKISTGTWKDGKLYFQMEGQNGTVTMSATVIDGKLSGEFDFAGQLQGRWVAVKKS